MHTTISKVLENEMLSGLGSRYIRNGVLYFNRVVLKPQKNSVAVDFYKDGVLLAIIVSSDGFTIGDTFTLDLNTGNMGIYIEGHSVEATPLTDNFDEQNW